MRRASYCYDGCRECGCKHGGGEDCDANYAELERLREAIEIARSAVTCDSVHHRRKDRHDGGTPCPVVDRFNKLINP